jgi:predicted ATP-binding protein involved in virulence
MRIVRLLRRAFPKVQFIITTHDPLCLRGVYDGEVFVMRRSEETGEVELVEELPSIRGMRAEQILTSEFFGLGSTDPETDAKMIRYHNLVVQGAETEEVERLRLEIESTMKVGDTVQEQVYAEALRRAAIDPFAPLAKVTTRARGEMVRDLLGAIVELRESHGPGVEG